MNGFECRIRSQKLNQLTLMTAERARSQGCTASRIGESTSIRSWESPWLVATGIEDRDIDAGRVHDRGARSGLSHRPPETSALRNPVVAVATQGHAAYLPLETTRREPPPRGPERRAGNAVRKAPTSARRCVAACSATKTNYRTRRCRSTGRPRMGFARWQQRRCRTESSRRRGRPPEWRAPPSLMRPQGPERQETVCAIPGPPSPGATASRSAMPRTIPSTGSAPSRAGRADHALDEPVHGLEP